MWLQLVASGCKWSTWPTIKAHLMGAHVKWLLGLVFATNSFSVQHFFGWARYFCNPSEGRGGRLHLLVLPHCPDAALWLAWLRPPISSPSSSSLSRVWWKWGEGYKIADEITVILKIKAILFVVCDFFAKLSHPASIGWVALSSLVCSFVRSFVRPASVTSPLISTIWCSRPYKPYIFC